ncbi:hypothetical protein PC116_g18496 [Phytophthora cactorum]|nr:hypothetical protein PC116_g18496 [Phytophthora cactorum]
MGSRTTVDFVGATSVSVLTEGSDSYRCTMTVTVANFPALCVPRSTRRQRGEGD